MKAALQGEIHYQNNHPGKGKGAAYTWVSSRTSTGPHHMLWSWCCCASRCSLQPLLPGRFPCAVALATTSWTQLWMWWWRYWNYWCSFFFLQTGRMGCSRLWNPVLCPTGAWSNRGGYSKMPQTHQKTRLPRILSHWWHSQNKCIFCVYSGILMLLQISTKYRNKVSG